MVAHDLWREDGDIPLLRSPTMETDIIEGEAKLGDGITFMRRSAYFRKEALVNGCPKAQHSYGLLLWSGFGSVTRDAEASAKFHAAAAYQNHLDGMAVFGGCLRTGTGVKQNVDLGERIIEYCASVGNPTGINKKATILESNGDYAGAVKLYEESYQRGRVNSLLLFNLGWCLVNGEGVDKKDTNRGISLWKEATKRAPDEGSEEAARFLYLEYERDFPREAEKWFNLAAELGYFE